MKDTNIKQSKTLPKKKINSMKRYTVADGYMEFAPDDGEWVHWSNYSKMRAEYRGEVRALKSQLEAAQAKLTRLTDDVKRLDWLDKQVKGHPYYTGYAWQETGYESDRGLVCKIQSGKNKMTARQAIDAARYISQGERP